MPWFTHGENAMLQGAADYSWISEMNSSDLLQIKKVWVSDEMKAGG